MMKRVGLALLASAMMVACGNGDDDDTTTGNSVDGDWVYANSSTDSGVTLTLTADGQYIAAIVKATSANSGNVQEDKGTYTVSGSSITFTPQESSCPSPDAKLTATYNLSDGNLTVAYPTGAIVFAPNTASSSSVAITLGCFDNSSGTFTPGALAPVSDD